MGLEAGANFFSRELPVSDAAPGRLYVGVCAPGRRLKPALIRVYVAALAAGQTLYEKYGEAADPFLTAVGYFSSLRELGGMRRPLAGRTTASRLSRLKLGWLKRTLAIAADSFSHEPVLARHSARLQRALRVQASNLETDVECVPRPRQWDWSL